MFRSTLRGSPLLILSVLFVALYGLDLVWSRDLWVQDEARYGEVVREMLADGQWLIPHLNGHPYPDKPPLYFWLVAALGGVVGHGELAFRLFSIVSTLAAVWGVWRVANQLAGRRAAFWSGALFLSMLLTLVVGHIYRMDMALTAAAVLAWDALLRRRAGGGTGSLLAFWGLTALTVAIKGPVGLAFTLLPAIVWITWEEGTGLWRRLRPFAGLAGLVAMVAAWIAAALATGHGDYLETVWREQLLGRAVKSWSHREPVYFYLVLLPFLLMPWSGLVGTGMWRMLRRRTQAWRAVLSFTLPPLIVLSLVSGKLFIYLQPLVPGFALAGGIAAATLRGQVAGGAYRRRMGRRRVCTGGLCRAGAGGLHGAPLAGGLAGAGRAGKRLAVRHAGARAGSVLLAAPAGRISRCACRAGHAGRRRQCDTGHSQRVRRSPF